MTLLADLSAVDRRILTELENAHGEGLVLAADLASLVEVPVAGIGSRLRSLANRGLVQKVEVRGWRKRYAWEITNEGIQAGPWSNR